MGYLVVIIYFGMVTLEYQVTEDYILRKATPNFPEVNEDLFPPFALLDQVTGKLYTVDKDCTYRTEGQFKAYDTGWTSDQDDLNQITTQPCNENGWSCIDIIEYKSSNENSPFGSGNESKTITRICQIPTLANLIQNENYYKFIYFYRTDIELPFKGIAIKHWLDYTIETEHFAPAISELKEIKFVEGTSADLESILNLPIKSR